MHILAQFLCRAAQSHPPLGFKQSNVRIILVFPKLGWIKRCIIESGCTSTFFMPQKGLPLNFGVEKLLLQTRNYIRSFALDECSRQAEAGRENVLLVIYTSSRSVFQIAKM